MHNLGFVPKYDHTVFQRVSRRIRPPAKRKQVHIKRESLTFDRPVLPRDRERSTPGHPLLGRNPSETQGVHLSGEDAVLLEQSVVFTLREMIQLGGRDTEEDLFDQNGNYVTTKSKMPSERPVKDVDLLL